MPRPNLLAAALAVLAGCATVPRPLEPRAGIPASPPDPAEVAREPASGPPGADAPAGDDAPASGARAAGDGAVVPDGGARTEPLSPRASEAQVRLVAHAIALLGERGPFRVGRERFRGDCSGFVAAVYASDGLDLGAALQRSAATQGRRGTVGLWLAARERDATFGEEAAPAPGDLVFWSDTYDRNRNRKADDPFTHVGIVERVDRGTVVFLHRGARGVARGFMTLARRHEARDADGRKLNSTVRRRSYPVRGGGSPRSASPGSRASRGCLAASTISAWPRRGRRPGPRGDRAAAADGAARSR